MKLKETRLISSTHRSFRFTTIDPTGGKDISKGITHIATKGFAVESSSSSFKLLQFKRRIPRADDVLIRIHFCGICHTDIHQSRNEWNNSKYPMVPGHEIIGVVEQIGSSVKNFHIGDYAGVGCVVDSCLKCNAC